MAHPTIGSKIPGPQETLRRAPSRTLYDRALLQIVLLIVGKSFFEVPRMWSFEPELQDHQKNGKRWCFVRVALALAERVHSKYRRPEPRRVSAVTWNQNDPHQGKGVL